jgi:hypothetical protein
VGHLGAGEDLQPVELLEGAPPAVRLDQPDDDVGAARLPTVGLTEHGEGLPDAGGGAQVDAQRAAGHASMIVPASRRESTRRVRITSRRVP